MDEICPKCGLPQHLCVCSEIAKESQKIKIRIVRRRFGKFVTIVSGFEKEEESEKMEKMLKKHLACGGTVKENKIELQGNHPGKVKAFLLKQGYREELIDA